MFKNKIYENASQRLQVHFNLVNKGKSSKCQIWLSSTINQERIRLYTGQRIERAFWNNKIKGHERAFEDGNFPAAQAQENKKINRELKRILEYCQEFLNSTSNTDLLDDAIHFEADAFKSFMVAKMRGEDALIRKNAEEFIKDYIERKSSMTNKKTHLKISRGTLYNHKNALQRLQKYCKRRSLKIVWELFNRKFGEDFAVWMMSEDYAANTIASQFSIMKVWLSEAEMEGLMTDKHFHDYPTATCEVENVYLTTDEIKRLYDIDFTSEEIQRQIDPHSNIEQTRDLFIVACWTALRYGDWHDLSQAQIVDGNITLKTHKTMENVVIPMHPMVRAILKKYGGNLPKSVDKSKTIKHIQLCAKMAHIDELITQHRIRGGEVVTRRLPKYKFITNHTARRSFCTNMYLAKVPTKAIMAISGHTTEENFRRYIKIGKEQYAEMVSKVFNEMTDTVS